jgi:hypothetical protein
MKNQMTPQQRIAAESSRRGRAEFVAGCISILDASELDSSLIEVLGGIPAHNVLAGAEGGIKGYWPRVWATRGLLHCYEPNAEVAIGSALSDESWRVREMALKVIARNGVHGLLEDVLPIRSDEYKRVRDAAERAVRLLITTSN